MSSEEKENIKADTEIQIPLADLIRTRRAKIHQMLEKGILPYPYKYDVSHHIDKLLEKFDQFVEEETVVRIAGRIMLKRKMGKVFFSDVHDMTGRIQIYVRKNDVGEEQFELFGLCDLGDIIGCEGKLFVTRTGERTLYVSKFEMLSKSLHPLPDKHAGLVDKEMRYRRRYADLIVNPEVRATFVLRSRIVRTIRDFLNAKDFLEVETPILQPMYGGGNARPFTTHHEKLGMQMYLRIADELYLKRLIVGGFDKVWEYCKDFRNEGLDRLHNPEFSMIELYWAYADYKDIAALMEELVRHTVFEVHGKYQIEYDSNTLDIEKPFKWISMVDSVTEATGVDFTDLDHEQALAEAKKLGLDTDNLFNRGKVIEAVWEQRVERNLIQPTFITGHPVEISPLAKKDRNDERYTERFELFMAGQEIANAFSELNDPVDQMERFLQQGKALEAGDDEAQPLDDDFITALTYGMPPTGGLGFGVDRLVMLLTNQHSIRDVILFPQMKDTGQDVVQVSQILNSVVEEEKSGK